MKKLIVLLFLTLFLSGCSNIRIIRKSDFSLPEYTMQECKDIPKAVDSTDLELLDQSKKTFGLYADCRSTNHEKKIILQRLQEVLK
ncbi:MAG TPA: lipoprotein [Methanosarcina sp.]|nr:lipoprotein [Methanosarcina sp.]